MKLKQKVVIIMTVILLFSTVLPVYADRIQELKEQLKKVNDDMKKTQSALKNLQKEKQSVLYEKELIEREIDMAENELIIIDQLLTESQKKIEEKQKEIERAEKAIDDQYELLKKRIRIMYEEGNATYLEILFESESFSEFLSKYEIVKEIVEFDNNLFHTMVEHKNILLQDKEELEREKAEREKVKRSLDTKKQNLNAKHASRNQMLQSLTTKQKDYEKALDELEETSKKVEKAIQREQELRKRQYAGGLLTWPTPGYTTITSYYGMRIHPITKKQRMHTGIDIGAPRNASVVAANDGVVIFSDWNGGYGKCIIIDHGGGIATLYAHNDKLLVREKQEVKKGQVIAKVGTTGLSTGPHLHFEVREKGRHINPMKYYKK